MLFGLLRRCLVRQLELLTAPWLMPYPKAETRIWNSGDSRSTGGDLRGMPSAVTIHTICDLSAIPYTTFRERASAPFSVTTWSAITISCITAGIPGRLPAGPAEFPTTKSKRLTATTDCTTSFRSEEHTSELQSRFDLVC